MPRAPRSFTYDAPGVEAAFDSVVDAVLVVDADGMIVFTNHAAERLFGYLRSELVGLPVETLIPFPLRADHRGHRLRYAVNPVGRPMGVGRELTAVRRDGTVFPVEISLAPMATPAGSYTTAVARDVTAQREEERASAERMRSEQHLALSQRVAAMGSWEQHLPDGQLQWSAELEHLLGGRPDEHGLEVLYEAVHPDDRSLLRAEVQRARREGGALSAQVRLGAAGAHRSVTVLGSVELDDAGRAVRSIGTVQDVTARTTLERALRASDERFRVAFDRAPIGMALVDVRPGHTRTLLMANTALSDMLGTPRPDLVGRPSAGLVDWIPDDDGRTPAFDDLLAGAVDAVHVAQARLLRPDRAERWVAIDVTLVRDADGVPDYLVTHLLDITDRKRAEADAARRAARDSRIADVLQAGLMPYVPRLVGPVRAASRYRPAGNGETVGGDWSDVLSLPGGRIGMVVGDVAGHGIESAAAMTRLRTIVRMLATSGVSPAGVMRRLNDVMHETDMGADIDLATLVYAQFDPPSGVLHYCSAGHLPLILVPGPEAGDRGPISPIPAVGGPPIGVVAGLRYTEQSLHLEPGCTLIGFTDGLIERRGDDLDESLLRLLSGLNGLPVAVTTDVEVLADAVLDLSPEGSVDDDIAVIVLGLDGAAAVTDQREPVAATARRGHALDLREIARPPDRWA